MEPSADHVFVCTGRQPYKTKIAKDGHEIAADEPLDAGGGDSGMTPYDLLLGALGSCTSMTLRMYADRKQWSLEAIVIRLQHQKIHAADCEECESRNGYVDHIEREIELTGELEPDQRQRLLEIANRCPVHRTLHSEVVVATTLIE